MERLLDVYQGYAADGRVASRQSLSNPGNRLIIQDRWRTARQLLAGAGLLPLGERRVLEVGTGGGAELAQLASLGGDPSRCCGIDLIPERIAAARARFPLIDFRVGDAQRLEFEDGRFDLVLVSTVLSSILDPAMRVGVAQEAVRVLGPGGAVLWYDMRYPSPGNQNVRPIGAGELRRLFPGLRATLRPVTLLPPLARRLGGLAPRLYPALAAAPFLRSHLAALLVKPGAA